MSAKIFFKIKHFSVAKFALVIEMFNLDNIYDQNYSMDINHVMMH